LNTERKYGGRTGKKREEGVVFREQERETCCGINKRVEGEREKR
jgi:hypothetical protein